MNKKLFEAVYRESNYGMSEVETEEQLQALLDADVEVEAHGTGPFGEDKGATVIGFGKIKDLRDMMEVDPEVLEYDDYESIDEFLNDSAEETVIVLSDTIGQSNNNYYTLDAYTVADLDLWASTAQMDKVLHNKEVDVCPNCGSNDFFDQEIGGKMYKGCNNCGAFFPKKD